MTSVGPPTLFPAVSQAPSYLSWAKCVNHPQLAPETQAKCVLMLCMWGQQFGVCTHICIFFFFFSPLQANAASVENKCKVTAAMVIVIMTAQKAHSRWEFFCLYVSVYFIGIILMIHRPTICYLLSGIQSTKCFLFCLFLFLFFFLFCFFSFWSK